MLNSFLNHKGVIQMDISSVAAQVTLFLMPFAPYLVSGGIEVAKGAAGKVGEIAVEKGWEQARKIWGKIKDKPNIQEAMDNLVQMPSDLDAQAVFRFQVKKTLADDKELLVFVNDILSQMSRSGNFIEVYGDRSVGIGGDAYNNTIITGDDNKIN